VGWLAELGAIDGNYYIDGAAPSAVGLAATGGVRAGPVAVLADFDAFELSPQYAMPPIPGSNASALDGQLLRLGLSARACTRCDLATEPGSLDLVRTGLRVSAIAALSAKMSA
jgi:hypothetical protein